MHQTSKLPSEERGKFLDWLFHFEYTMLGLPAPDRVMYLDLPTEVTEQLMRRREADTNSHADIHEQDSDYLRRCRENAAFVVERCGWERVDCAKDGVLRSVEDIHSEIVERLSDLL